MILISELLGRTAGLEPPIEHRLNLGRLHYVLNFIRILCDRPMAVNSGYRTKEDHFRIYEKINRERASKGLAMLPVPMGSNHLIGAAADISDPLGTLKEWCIKNIRVLEDLGVYCEAFEATPVWTHFQIYPPHSGERFFNP